MSFLRILHPGLSWYFSKRDMIVCLDLYQVPRIYGFAVAPPTGGDFFPPHGGRFHPKFSWLFVLPQTLLLKQTSRMIRKMDNTTILQKKELTYSTAYLDSQFPFLSNQMLYKQSGWN